MEPVRPRRRPMSEINVVPYIDVMLVLLVIFMVTAPMLMQGIEVELPKTESDQIQVDSDALPLVVAVDQFGAYFIEMGEERGETLGLGEVVNQVRMLREEKSATRVLVRGDARVAYGTVVNLMGALRVAGVSNVGLITELP